MLNEVPAAALSSCCSLQVWGSREGWPERRCCSRGTKREACSKCQLTSQVGLLGVSMSTQDVFTAGFSRIGSKGTPAYAEGTSAAFLAPPVTFAGVGANGLEAITVSLQRRKLLSLHPKLNALAKAPELQCTAVWTATVVQGIYHGYFQNILTCLSGSSL